jgi:type IV secretory pathway VirD2 relaxase
VIRGVDRDGRELRFDRGYISRGLRWRAQELATLELGPRLAIDIERARTREVTQERFTSLDHEIAGRAGEGRIELRSLARGAAGVDPALVGRLRHLEVMRLAERTGPGVWDLAPGWNDRLRALGERNDIYKQMHRAVSGDLSRYRILGRDQAPAEFPQPITGRVAGKGLLDEEKGRYYAIIETPDGRAFHTPINTDAATHVRVGDVVTLERGQSCDGWGLKKHYISLEEQVRLNAPVWLDRLQVRELAPYGFGAELHKLLERRQEVLRKRELDRGGPDRGR